MVHRLGSFLIEILSRGTDYKEEARSRGKLQFSCRHDIFRSLGKLGSMAVLAMLKPLLLGHSPPRGR